MARTTMKALASLAEKIGRYREHEVAVSSQHGGKRFVERHPDTSESNVSPRLSSGDLERWAWAYLQGAGDALQRVRDGEVTP